jgi:hypothetical protein
MLITPDPSPNTKRITTNTPINQPKEMANETSSTFTKIETPHSPTHQREDDDDWYAPMMPPPTITRIWAPQNAAITKMGELLDGKAKNWSGWSQAMELLFNLFSV